MPYLTATRVISALRLTTAFLVPPTLRGVIPGSDTALLILTQKHMKADLQPFPLSPPSPMSHRREALPLHLARVQ